MSDTPRTDAYGSPNESVDESIIQARAKQP